MVMKNNKEITMEKINRFSDCRDIEEVRVKACSLLNSVWDSVHDEYNGKIYGLAKKAYAMKEYVRLLADNGCLPSEYPFFVDCKDGDYSDFQFSGGVWFSDEGRNLEEEKKFYENRLDEVERELGEAERYIFDYDQSDEFVSEIEKISKEGGEQYSRFGGGDWEDLWRDMYEDFCNNL